MSSLVYIVALRDASIQIYTTALQGLWYLNNSNSMSEKTEVDVLLNSETAPCQEFPSVYQWRYKWISHFFFCHLLFSLSVSIVKPTRYTNVSNLFYFGMTRYMFRPVFPSDFCLLAAANKQTEVSVWQTPVATCIVLKSWWWTEKPYETCRVSFQNKINLIH